MELKMKCKFHKIQLKYFETWTNFKMRHKILWKLNSKAKFKFNQKEQNEKWNTFHPLPYPFHFSRENFFMLLAALVIFRFDLIMRLEEVPTDDVMTMICEPWRFNNGLMNWKQWVCDKKFHIGHLLKYSLCRYKNSQ